MSSIEKEKGMLKEWAVKATGRMEEYDVDRGSYWNTYEADEDIIDYDFQTIPVLRKMFEKNLVGCDDVALPLSVATFKKKHQVSIKSENDKNGNKDDSGSFEIPEFIYIF